MSLSSPAKRYALSDPDGWLARVGTLRELELRHMEALAVVTLREAEFLAQLTSVYLAHVYKLPQQVSRKR